MKSVHIVGSKNSGKTTLIVELVDELRSRGLRVGTLKHTHHNHEFDIPNKDSYRHRKAGAVLSGLISPTMCGLFWDHINKEDKQSRQRFGAIFADCHIVLIEGDQHSEGLKVEVWRSETGQHPLAQSNQSIAAVVSDDKPDVSCPLWPRSNIPLIANKILTLDHEI